MSLCYMFLFSKNNFVILLDVAWYILFCHMFYISLNSLVRFLSIKKIVLLDCYLCCMVSVYSVYSFFKVSSKTLHT